MDTRNYKIKNKETIMNTTQQQIVVLHFHKKKMRKVTHAVEDEENLIKEIFRLRRQLIAELYPKG